jgi:hypothetical protein
MLYAEPVSELQIGGHLSGFQIVNLHRTIPTGRDDLFFIMTEMNIKDRFAVGLKNLQ